MSRPRRTAPRSCRSPGPTSRRPTGRTRRDRVGEWCSLGALDGGEVVYVARAGTRRITSIALGVGSLVPPYGTSMERVLLAQRPDAALDAYRAARRP